VHPIPVVWPRRNVREGLENRDEMGKQPFGGKKKKKEKKKADKVGEFPFLGRWGGISTRLLGAVAY